MLFVDDAWPLSNFNVQGLPAMPYLHPLLKVAGIDFDVEPSLPPLFPPSAMLYFLLTLRAPT